MSGFVEWIAAEADQPDRDGPLKSSPALTPVDERSLCESSPGDAQRQELPGHSFPVRSGFPDEAQLDDPPDRNPDLWLYRKRTVGMLRRYMRFSLETGRLPSFVGREFFRAKVTYYTATTFEDRVIFVRDVERCMARLEYWDQQLIVRIILQEHSQEQTARILQCSRSTVARRLPQVLDLLSENFLGVGLLTELPSKGESSQ